MCGWNSSLYSVSLTSLEMFLAERPTETVLLWPHTVVISSHYIHNFRPVRHMFIYHLANEQVNFLALDLRNKKLCCRTGIVSLPAQSRIMELLWEKEGTKN